LLDDDAYLSELLRTIPFSGRVEVAGQTSDAREAVALTHMLAPDVVVVDVLMVLTNGPEVLNELSRDPRTCDVPVVLLGGPTGVEHAGTVNKSGGSHVARLADGRQGAASVAVGEASPGGAEIVQATGVDPSPFAEVLSDREWDVMMHLRQSQTDKEIARRLNMSMGTLRSHKARIRRKLHVPAEMHLSRFARRNFGMVADGETAFTTKAS
jgi:two-component system nitrate/nitrite response regulator NarL